MPNASVVYGSEVELGKRPPLSAEGIEKLAALYSAEVSPLLEAACRGRGHIEIDMGSPGPPFNL